MMQVLSCAVLGIGMIHMSHMVKNNPSKVGQIGLSIFAAALVLGIGKEIVVTMVDLPLYPHALFNITVVFLATIGIGIVFYSDFKTNKQRTALT